MAKSILYLITTYNPKDRNYSYLTQKGYIYQNLHGVRKIVDSSSYNIDVVVSDFGSGKRTRDALLSFRDKEKMDMRFVFGPDRSHVVACNTAVLAVNQGQYDFVFYSVSDVIVKNPRVFDTTMNEFDQEEKCDFIYVIAEPGLALPHSQMEEYWYTTLPIDRAVHFNVYVVKKKLLDYCRGRLIIDIFESSTVEIYLGYVCHAQGGYRKISKHLFYDHIGGRKYTDRKTAFKTKGGVLGGGYCIPSVYLKRDLESIIETGNKSGIRFDRKSRSGMPRKTCNIDKFRPLPRKERLKLSKFVQSNLFLSEDELDYNSIPIKIV